MSFASKSSAINHAVRRHRERLGQAGIARFEVKAPVGDKALVRRVAEALSKEAGDDLRRRMEAAIDPAPPSRKGGILQAFLSSPLVGADVEFARIAVEPRKVDL